jgi:hypothetical protein
LRHGIVGLLIVILAGALFPAGAQANSRRVTPEFFGAQDDRVRPFDGAAFGSARVWAAWCTVQSSPSTAVATSAAKKLEKPFAIYSKAGVTRLTVSLGHPSGWVFGDHKRAKARNSRVWFCEKSVANTSFPLAAALRKGPVRDRYSEYVSAVISAAKPYLKANPANKLVLQAWNEPNLKNGGVVNRRVPGAARSWSQASQSLQEQERIMRIVAQAMIPGRFEITSPSLYGKKTGLNTAYFRDQARNRTVDSISLNFYTLRQKSVNKSLALWRKKAAVAKRLVTRHRSLRSVPIWITETNHNLLNFVSERPNETGVWATAMSQRRMVEVTTMEALRQGFAGIMWYAGVTQGQTAVNTAPGKPATVSTRALRSVLLGRVLVGCTSKRGVTTCTMSALPGKKAIKIRWYSGGRAGVTILT